MNCSLGTTRAKLRLRAPATPDHERARPEAEPRAGSVPAAASRDHCTTAQACYAETLARLRPTATMRALLKNEDLSSWSVVPCPATGAPAACSSRSPWRTAFPSSTWNIPRTHEYLTAAMSEQLSGFGITQLDVSDVHGRNRLLTRPIASWAYAAVMPTARSTPASAIYPASANTNAGPSSAPPSSSWNAPPSS